MAEELVAVYGTLRVGGYNHCVMDSAGGDFIGSFWTHRDFAMYDLGSFPAVALKGSSSIFVEIYNVVNLDPIDRLEGYPHLYQRAKVETPWGQAWIYHMDRRDISPQQNLVPSGNWMIHTGKEKDAALYVSDGMWRELRA